MHLVAAGSGAKFLGTSMGVQRSQNSAFQAGLAISGGWNCARLERKGQSWG
jgi:hypothetical protein